MTACPTADTLQRLLAHRLDPVQHTLIEAHVNVCNQCQQALAQVLHDEQAKELPGLVRDSQGNDSTVIPFLDSLKQRDPGCVARETTSQLPPRTIGKYQIQKEIASGAFGRVYLGFDAQMRRPVAIKVPTGLDVPPNDSQAREQFLHEARSVARLRHANIVAAHDFGQEPDGSCYLVYDFIEGITLAERLKLWKESPLPTRETAALVVQMAEALHYAHLQGLVHRDIKPANILLDVKGKPFVTDFGIAVHEADLARERGVRAGSPPYMAPEQVRGEGHLIDGRTDIYSLGVLFYECLTGQRPFQAETLDGLFELILSREARPPRMIDDTIPRELERICLKAMSKRITDRYTTAQDLADDLRLALREKESTPSAIDSSIIRTVAPAAVVPRGLRSFGPEDADFFLKLLPGPHDRQGLPESIRFWKVCIESAEAESAFRVGLIHGPSGCGKTSLIRAGLLPRLPASITPIYVEAIRDGTEDRLLARLKRFNAQAGDLVTSIADLRHGTGLKAGDKVLVVIDQLEQWLLANSANLTASPLVAALRQADGLRVQFLLMVRDDFWSATARLFDELEIPMDNESNLRMVDLFDFPHARRVLQFFGQAYDCLPPHAAAVSAEQQRFLEQVVEGLGQNGKVISVHLSLFADMMKSRPWTAQSLQALGGPQGVGVKFLEETFSSATANPQHCQDEQPARGLLAALLPEAGADIKGRMRSRAELLAASGLTHAPARFERLLKTLDHDLRIITPAESWTVDRGPRTDEARVAPRAPRPTPHDSFQLTHDFLIAPLREWLTRKKRETWRGRAEFVLEERTGQWTRQKIARFLPSAAEYVRIVAGVPASRRKPDQRAMMRAAHRHYGVRAGFWLIFLGLVAWSSWELNGFLRARGLVQTILSAAPDKLEPLLVNDLPTSHRRAHSQLLAIAQDPSADPSQRLRASLACLPEQRDYLCQHLYDCTLAEFLVVCKRLKPCVGDCTGKMWQDLRTSPAPAVRFRAGLALAEFTPESSAWSEEDLAFLARQLIEATPGDQPYLRGALQPIHGLLLAPLQTLLREPRLDPTLRQAAAIAFLEYAPDDATALTDMACESEADQYRPFLQRIAELGKNSSNHAAILKTLRNRVKPGPQPVTEEEQNVVEGRRRARVAITLLRFGERAEALATLKVADNPEALAQFVVRARSFGVTLEELADCLAPDLDDSVRYGLLLALGDFAPADLPEGSREAFIGKLQAWYRSDRSSAVHGACEWLLRKWNAAVDLRSLSALKQPPPFDAKGGKEWFVLDVDGQRRGFVVLEPGRFLRGSPAWEARRVVDDEQRHSVVLRRPIAFLDREVTMAQWLQFLRAKDLDVERWEARDNRPNCKSFREGLMPAHHVTWHEAVEFCRWLTARAGLDDEQCYEEDMSARVNPAPPPLGKLGQVIPGFAMPDPAAAKPLLPVRKWHYHPDRLGFRLPTEAEWEYACRAGTATTFGFGSDPSLLKHFSVHLSDEAGSDAPLVGGSKMPNLRGLFDMHGNVWEWCHDTRAIYNEKKTEVDPVGLDARPSSPAEGSGDGSRAYRGGSFDNYAKHHRAACRIFEQPTRSFNYVGFRIVCTLLRAKGDEPAADGQMRK